jgi:hypothetical protein
MGPLFATHRFLTRVALSSIHVFAWLFLFQYFYVFHGSLGRALVSVASAYALTQVLSILITPITAWRLRHGIRGMLVNALLSLAGAFAMLAAAFSGMFPSVAFGILGFCALMALYRALYWIPYEIAAKKAPRSYWIEGAAALVPALSGIYLMSSPVAPIIALSVASLVALMAIIPLYAMKNTHEGFSWGFRETFRHLFTRSHRAPLIRAICNGFEGAALLLLWPITVLVLLDWSFALLGIVLSFTLLCSMLARILLERHRAHIQTPVIHSVMTLSGWILRGTVAAPFAVVLVDASYHTGSGSSERGVDLLTYEQSSDSNTYIDEFTALKDIGQGIGRILFCGSVVLLGALLSFGSLVLTLFFLAGVVAVISVGLAKFSVRHSF